LAVAGLAGALLGPVAGARAQTMPAPPAAALGTPAPAAQGPWTLQAAVDYAVAHNLGVRQTQFTAQQQEAAQRLQRAALLPTAGLNANQTFSFGTNKDPFTNQFQAVNVRGNNFTASALVTLFSGFQLRNTIKQGTLDAQAARVDIDKARNDLSLNVASSFLQLLLAQELIRASEARLSTVQAQVVRSEKLFKAGAVAEGNVLDSRAQLAGEERTLVTAQNQRDLAQLALVQELNLDPASAARFDVVVPTLPDPTAYAAATANDFDPNATYALASQHLPEIKAADLRVESARCGIDIARGAYFPRLTMAGGIQTGYSSVRTQQVRTTGDPIPVPILQVNPAVPGGYAPSPYVLLTPQTSFAVLPYGFFDQLADNRGEFLQFTLNVPILNGLQSRVGVQRAQLNVQQNELRAEQTRVSCAKPFSRATPTPWRPSAASRPAPARWKRFRWRFATPKSASTTACSTAPILTLPATTSPPRNRI